MDPNDCLETPKHIILAARKLFGVEFDLDVCAHRNNVCERFWTIEDDGLKHEWPQANIWCNPPYSRGNIERWVAKAINSQIDDQTTTMLLPANTGTKWFHWLVGNNWNIVLLEGRIRFDQNGVQTKQTGSFDSMLAHKAGWTTGKITCKKVEK